MAGGRGGRGGRNPRDLPRDQQISRKVSWLLRHGAQQEGLKLGKGGYVSVADALNTRALKGLNITFEELREVVRKNDKQRFSMIPASSLPSAPTPDPTPADSAADPTPPPALDTITESSSTDPADYLIRANQGHSLTVDTEGLLTPITLAANNIPATVVHGTTESAWRAILLSGGMRRMGRTHMHFATGLPANFHSADAAAAPVISGMRNSSTVLIYVDVEKALEDGIKWFVSENGVVLCEGDEAGSLGVQYFSRVEKRGGQVLMRDGVLPEGTVVDVQAWEEEFAGRGGRGRGGRGGGRGGRGRGRGGGKPRVRDDGGDLLAGVE